MYYLLLLCFLFLSLRLIQSPRGTISSSSEERRVIESVHLLNNILLLFRWW